LFCKDENNNYIVDSEYYNKLPENYEKKNNTRKYNRFVISNKLLTDPTMIEAGKERKAEIEKKKKKDKKNQEVDQHAAEIDQAIVEEENDNLSEILERI
jgi:hypothetical protein